MNVSVDVPGPAYVLYSRTHCPGRRGETCRLVARVGHWQDVVIRFDRDGHEATVPRQAIRRVKE